MSRTTIVALAWALVHFIWQGAAIALASGFVCAAARRARPATRYVVLCVALGAMVLSPVATFFAMRTAPFDVAGSTVAVPAVAAPAGPAPAAAAAATSAWTDGNAWLVGLVQVWLSGVALLGIHALGGWAWAQRLKRFKTSPVAASLEQAAAALGRRLGIRRAVRVMRSAAAEVPATLGWLKPVVLIPVSAFTALTPDQIELLIAHELAHIRRHDYLVNLAQTAIETVLFYHPAVWWVSGRIRDEREHCCDDLAVAACGNAASYVKALAALEGLRTRRTSLVMAANGGSLLHRIQRLARPDRTPREAPPAWLGGFVPAAVVIATVLSATPPKADAAPASKPKGEPMGFLGELAETGYPKLSVDEIIAIKDHGVDAAYVEGMLAAGLGVPSVPELIRLHDHGVPPSFVAGMASSGLVSDLDFETVIRLRENDARADDMMRIRALGFGPFAAGEVIRLRQNAATAETFAALKAAGANHAGISEAIEFRQLDVTVERIRDMERQGFHNLSVEQILKLRRAGII